MRKTNEDLFAPMDDMRGWNTKEHCPWCKKPIDDIHEYLHHGAEDAEFGCPHCENPIELREWRQFIMQRVEK